MTTDTAGQDDRDGELERLRTQLAEAQAVLDAIRRGQIDAVVVDSPEGSRIFTVAGAERPYRVFIENMGEGAASLSPEGVILFANPQLAKLLDLETTAINGSNLYDYLSPADEEQLRAAMASAAPAQHVGLELTLRRNHAADMPIALTATAFEDQGTRTICVIVTDLTEKKRAEEHLRQAQSVEAVAQLTTGVAHDFNNLLTVILGGLQLLERRLTDKQPLRIVSEMANSTRRGAKLVQQLLAFARKQHLEPQPVDINQVIAGAVDLLRATLGPAVEVVTTLEPDLERALADPTQVEMMVVNLSLNARDAMARGGTLRISTANVRVALGAGSPPDLVPGAYVRLTLTDTGAGMGPEVRARAIEPFFTTKAAGAGTGLGLSQVYGIAKQFHGTVAIESAPGKGTAVHVYLPRAAPAAPAAPAAASHALTAGAKGPLILLVDDDDVVRAMTADMLGDLGYRVLDADGAARALELLRSTPEIDVLLSDIAMPSVNGVELAEQARQLRADLPIQLMTGYADFAKHAAGTLAYPVLRKPFDFTQLDAALKEVMSAPRGAA
jgi:PAS domain S-box-containing protein